MEIRICHLYPDLLNLYGDRGNVICMKKRLEWRGIDCAVTELPLGETAQLSRFDLFFIGGGQDFEQEVLLEDLARGKAREIKAAVNDGKTFLAICGGYQMLGQYYETWDGIRCDFIGALDLCTIGAKTRMTGNYMYECPPENGGCTVVGFENHSGKTRLGPGLKPLGKIVSGFGNNGEDGTEGVRYNNVFGTYSHGPVLPKNPGLCDFILSTALGRRGLNSELAPLDDRLENAAHGSMEAKIRKTVL